MLTTIPTILLISLFIRAIYDFGFRQRRKNSKNLKLTVDGASNSVPEATKNSNTNDDSTATTDYNTEESGRDSSTDRESDREASIKIVTRSTPQTSTTNKNIGLNRKRSKTVVISKIRNMSKLLLLSSLIWSICYASAAVSFVFMHLFFNFTPVSCANRSILTIFYAFQRTSLMLFFISRLHHTFANTRLETKSLYIKLFVLITVIVYNGASIWYVLRAYETQNGVYCDSTPMVAPAATVVLIDVAWNLFLGIYFQRKLREVCLYCVRTINYQYISVSNACMYCDTTK